MDTLKTKHPVAKNRLGSLVDLKDVNDQAASFKFLPSHRKAKEWQVDNGSQGSDPGVVWNTFKLGNYSSKVLQLPRRS